MTKTPEEMTNAIANALNSRLLLVQMPYRGGTSSANLAEVKQVIAKHLAEPSPPASTPDCTCNLRPHRYGCPARVTEHPSPSPAPSEGPTFSVNTTYFEDDPDYPKGATTSADSRPAMEVSEMQAMRNDFSRWALDSARVQGEIATSFLDPPTKHRHDDALAFEYAKSAASAALYFLGREEEEIAEIDAAFAGMATDKKYQELMTGGLKDGETICAHGNRPFECSTCYPRGAHADSGAEKDKK